jgi:hypothetical protein
MRERCIKGIARHRERKVKSVKKPASVGFALATSVLSVVLVGAAPAEAGGTNGPLCLLNSNAYMYNVPLGQYVSTVHWGYHFRVHAFTTDVYGRAWDYGHSGEDPARDGYVLADHVDC